MMRPPLGGGLIYMKESSVTVGRAGRLSVHTLDERALGMRGTVTLLPACAVIIGHSEWLLEMFLYKFLTRPGCHLCDAARPIVLAGVREVGGEVVEVDIDGDDGLLAEYGARIPVVLAPDGEVIAEGVIERRALRRSVRRSRVNR
jgi:hypothetical protein